MSVKNSLLGQSLVRNANALSFNGESQEKHWKRDWYSPPKSQSASASVTPSGTPTPFGEESITGNEQKSYAFKVKVWQVDYDYKSVVDSEEDDVLDLQLFSTIKHKGSNEDLSDDAIRGAAVSTSDAIPGIPKATDETVDAKINTEDSKPVENSVDIDSGKVEATHEDIKVESAPTETSTNEDSDLQKAESEKSVDVAIDAEPSITTNGDAPKIDSDGDIITE